MTLLMTSLVAVGSERWVVCAKVFHFGNVTVGIRETKTTSIGMNALIPQIRLSLKVVRMIDLLRAVMTSLMNTSTVVVKV